MSDQQPASTLGSGLLGAAVALGCLLPPILHLVTGPLGPAIGGYMAGLRARAGGRQAGLIGLIVGLTLALPPIGVAIFLPRHARLAWGLAAGLFAYGAVVAALAAVKGGAAGRRLEESEES